MIYTTKILAVDPRAPMGPPIQWSGPKIEARSWEDAEAILQAEGMGYCQIDGEYVETIDEETGKELPIHTSPWIYHN